MYMQDHDVGSNKQGVRITEAYVLATETEGNDEKRLIKSQSLLNKPANDSYCGQESYGGGIPGST